MFKVFSLTTTRILVMNNDKLKITLGLVGLNILLLFSV